MVRNVDVVVVDVVVDACCQEVSRKRLKCDVDGSQKLA